LEKAPDAFRTISEVADEIDVPQHVLRFWESRFPQIRPMKRGGGRRYYRPDDVDLLRGVRHLLYGEGYTIRGVQRILREQGVTFVQTIWSAEQDAPPPDADDEDDAESAEEAIERANPPRSEPNLFAVAPPRAQQPAAKPMMTPIVTPGDERREPTIVPPLSVEPSPPEQPSPPTQPSSAQPPAEEPSPPVITAANRQKLQAALDELIACRGTLEAALQNG
jgi:DNA-binding transcriptional MerR regulator